MVVGGFLFRKHMRAECENSKCCRCRTKLVFTYQHRPYHFQFEHEARTLLVRMYSIYRVFIFLFIFFCSVLYGVLPSTAM